MLVGIFAAQGAYALSTNSTAVNPVIDNGIALVSAPAVYQSAKSVGYVTTTFITITSVEEKTYTVTPLPSKEAKAQESAFSKAQGQSNEAANQIKSVMSAQGKVVPSAMVPAQPKQTEILHSGLYNIVDTLNNTDYSQDVAASPEGGNFYIKFFNGSDFDIPDAYSKKYDAHLPITVSNPSTKGMCVMGHVKDTSNDANIIPFAYNNTKVAQLYVGPNSTVQIGNFLPKELLKKGVFQKNGRLQGYHNANKDCTKYAGDREGPVMTLFEFTFERTTEDGEMWTWHNPSLGKFFNSDNPTMD